MPPERLNGGAIMGSLPTARNDMLWGLSTVCAAQQKAAPLLFWEAPHKKALTIHFFSVMMRPSNRRAGRVLRKTHPFREPPVGARRRETGGGMALRGQTERGRSPSVWATGLASRYPNAAVCRHGQSGRVCAKPGGTAGVFSALVPAFLRRQGLFLCLQPVKKERSP